MHREIKEELGITVKTEKLWNVYAPVFYTYQNQKAANCDIFYLVEHVSGTPQPADDVADFQWFPLSMAPVDEMAFSSGQKALQELQDVYLHSTKKKVMYESRKQAFCSK